MPAGDIYERFVLEFKHRGQDAWEYDAEFRFPAGADLAKREYRAEYPDREFRVVRRVLRVETEEILDA